MDEVTANMAELTGHVSALTGLARGISDGLGVPLLRFSGFAFGVRRALALRRPGRAAAATAREPGVLPYRRAAISATREALPAGPDARPAGSRPARTGRATARPRTRPVRGGREEVRG